LQNAWRFRQCRSLADLGNPSLVRLILFYFYVAVGPASRPMSFPHERYLVALEFLLRIKRLLANVRDVSTTAF